MILTFITFAIEKCQTLKFLISSKDTEILQSYLEGNESERESQKRTISRNSIIIPLKFHEISLVLCNLVNYCKIMPYLVKFSKSPKDLGKIL